jgi:predicted enzyme related to lactoylglutathione lyase
MFGWTFQIMKNYTIASNDERPLCGLIQRPRPADSSAHPRWFAYLSVPSVAEAERAVIGAGGRVLAPPQEFPKRGEQAVFADPEGAIFGVIKSSSGDPQDFLADVGDWIWIQLLSRDARQAAEFYRTVGGYDIVEDTTSNQLNDYVLVSEGYARATVRTIPAEHKQVRPTWLLFVRVKNIGGSLALTKQLGGKVLLEPKPELFDGKVAVIADPAGAAIGILEWGEKVLKGAN